MTGTIEINGLRLFARHGVYEQERELGNKFEVTAHLHYPIEGAMESDDLTSTLNYAEAVNVITEVMAIPSKLLENVAYRIHKALMEKFPSISGGTIKISKLNPPIPAELKDVAVIIEF